MRITITGQCRDVHPDAPHHRCVGEVGHTDPHRTDQGEWPNVEAAKTYQIQVGTHMLQDGTPCTETEAMREKLHEKLQDTVRRWVHNFVLPAMAYWFVIVLADKQHDRPPSHAILICALAVLVSLCSGRVKP